MYLSLDCSRAWRHTTGEETHEELCTYEFALAGANVKEVVLTADGKFVTPK
jgi:hypothetical protein